MHVQLLVRAFRKEKVWDGCSRKFFKKEKKRNACKSLLVHAFWVIKIKIKRETHVRLLVRAFRKCSRWKGGPGNSKGGAGVWKEVLVRGRQKGRRWVERGRQWLERGVGGSGHMLGVETRGWGSKSWACISLSWAALAYVSFQMGLMSEGTYLRLETRLRMHLEPRAQTISSFVPLLSSSSYHGLGCRNRGVGCQKHGLGSKTGCGVLKMWPGVLKRAAGLQIRGWGV